jgi:hypothetical protein
MFQRNDGNHLQRNEPLFAGTVSLGTDFASKRIISYGLNPILLLGNPFGNAKDRMLKQHA